MHLGSLSLLTSNPPPNHSRVAGVGWGSGRALATHLVGKRFLLFKEQGLEVEEQGWRVRTIRKHIHACVIFCSVILEKQLNAKLAKQSLWIVFGAILCVRVCVTFKL